MTEKELIDKLLGAIYDRRGQSYVDLQQLIADGVVAFENAGQRDRILEYLVVNGYIKTQAYLGGRVDIEITSKGVQKIEEQITESLIDTDRLMRNGEIEPDLSDVREEGSDTNLESQLQIRTKVISQITLM